MPEATLRPMISTKRLAIFSEVLLELATHGGGDKREIGRADLQVAEAERGSPMRLVADEGQPLDQRPDGRFPRLEVFDVDPERLEARAHPSLIHLASLHAADRGEGLQRV